MSQKSRAIRKVENALARAIKYTQVLKDKKVKGAQEMLRMIENVQSSCKDIKTKENK